MSTGTHRPLEAKLIALARDDAEDPLLLVALDLGWWMSAEDEWSLRGSILAATGLEPENLILALTHTHSGPSIARGDADAAGGDLIGPYLDGIERSISSTAAQVLLRLEPCLIDWARGSCDLAVNRDLYRADEGRYVVGANPCGETDSALVVGRLTTAGGATLAVIGNYAMHATSLGGENTMVSPDFVGAARELVESEHDCTFVFLQGASGDLSPREQYSSDPATADKHGRTLGLSVLSVINNMLEPGTTLCYERTIESGAPLGNYVSTPLTVTGPLEGQKVEIELPTQRNTPAASPNPAVQADRELRAARIRSNVEESMTTFPVTVWTIGDTRVIAYPGEAYSDLQKTLRAEFPDRILVFVNLANGAHLGYLPPAAAYAEGRYPAWQSPLGPGSLELLIDASRAQLQAQCSAPRPAALGART